MLLLACASASESGPGRARRGGLRLQTLPAPGRVARGGRPRATCGVRVAGVLGTPVTRIRGSPAAAAPFRLPAPRPRADPAGRPVTREPPGRLPAPALSPQHP